LIAWTQNSRQHTLRKEETAVHVGIASEAAELTIVTVVDQAPLDCRLEITGRRDGGCNLEVSAWKGLAQIFGRA
jgi:hypothetical protein